MRIANVERISGDSELEATADECDEAIGLELLELAGIPNAGASKARVHHAGRLVDSVD